MVQIDIETSYDNYRLSKYQYRLCTSAGNWFE